MTVEPIKTKNRGANRLHYGLAAGMLVLTMSVVGSVTEADSQPPAGVQEVRPSDPIGNKLVTNAKTNKVLQWFQIGTASWYGPRFQGKTTANGETFDMNGLTCAHRSLPMGSWVKVTNLKNRRSIFVRVNDRGPVPDDRVVDLSYGAAQAVGLMGIGKVKLETLKAGDRAMEQELLAQLQIPVIPVPGQ
jgi:rare lipoprotein A